MKAVELRSVDGFDGLQVVERPDPVCGSRDVIVRMRATSLNYRDLFLPLGTMPREGNYLGIIPLSDGAGEVVEIGRDVRRVKVGDRVSMPPIVGWVGGPIQEEFAHQNIGFDMDGTLCEFAAFPDHAVVRIPDYMSYAEAAALPCAGTSAWAALRGGLSPVAAGHTVLVQGTGGVALLALQFAKIAGARVLAITSSDEKAAFLTKLGADAVINYTDCAAWDDEVLSLTNGRGVDRVIEIGGAGTIARSAKATRVGGTISSVGFVAGREGGADPLLLISRALNLNCYLMGNRSDFEDMLAAMDLHDVHPPICQSFTMSDVQMAYSFLYSGKHTGKVVVNIS
jgi:NADPH:quinone reductase-like Zn-dependent oxidoreductase